MPGAQEQSGAGSAPGAPLATAAGGSRTRTYQLTGLNVNQTGADIGTFTGLPSKYAVRRLTLFDASTSLTLATLDLRTAAAGAGNAVVAAFALAALTAASKFIDATLAITADYQTAASLIVRAVTAQGGAATVSAVLEIEDLS